MKLDLITLTYIQNVVRTAKLVNIDSIIIEPNIVRAISEDNSVVILQNKDVPDMPFGSIGMNRLDVFAARYEVLRSQDNFSIEVEVDTDSNCARGIVMKAKGTKLDYRCAKPAAIKAPRQINDVLKHRVITNAETTVLLQKAISAMQNPEFVTLVSDNDGVTFKFSDVNNDTFEHTFMEKPETLTPDATGKFAHRYFVKTLFPLLKQNPEGHFDVGQKGILAFYVNNLTVYVLPQA